MFWSVTSTYYACNSPVLTVCVGIVGAGGRVSIRCSWVLEALLLQQITLFVSKLQKNKNKTEIYRTEYNFSEATPTFGMDKVAYHLFQAGKYQQL